MDREQLQKKVRNLINRGIVDVYKLSELPDETLKVIYDLIVPFKVSKKKVK